MQALLLLRFLRGDKNDKIKQNTIINDYEKGGLKMIDVLNFNKALKLQGSEKKCLDNDNHAKWKCFFDDAQWGFKVVNYSFALKVS